MSPLLNACFLLGRKLALQTWRRAQPTSPRGALSLANAVTDGALRHAVGAGVRDRIGAKEKLLGGLEGEVQGSLFGRCGRIWSGEVKGNMGWEAGRQGDKSLALTHTGSPTGSYWVPEPPHHLGSEREHLFATGPLFF